MVLCSKPLIFEFFFKAICTTTYIFNNYSIYFFHLSILYQELFLYRFNIFELFVLSRSSLFIFFLNFVTSFKTNLSLLHMLDIIRIQRNIDAIISKIDIFLLVLSLLCYIKINLKIHSYLVVEGFDLNLKLNFII